MNAPLEPNEAAGPASSQQTTSRRLTVLYIFALSTVAVLSIGAQWLIQQQLSNGESDSRVINVAGRQRMLSQRLAKVSLRIAYEETTSDDARVELSETLKTWAANHRALQDGDAITGLPGGNSDEVKQLFASIKGDFDAMRTAAARLLQEPAEFVTRDVAHIQSHEVAFLRGMDRIVSQLVAEAEQRVARLRTLEWAILALTLIVLLAEGLFIFRPAAKHIQVTVARLSALSESLRRSRDEAERANAAKTRFLANVSHELRTPMTAVLGMTELAQRADTPEERLRYLGIVEEAGQTLLGLLNDLIDLSQIDAEALEIRNEPFSPFESVRRVVRMLEPTCQAKGLRLESELQGDELTLLGDARRLEQVLVNLVANAIKWTDSGEVRVVVDLRLDAEQARLKLSVSDTGVGIASEEQQRVFEPFAQAHHEGAPRGGVGLGLAICQRLTHAMGGRIDLRSDLGAGTTVTLEACLPVSSNGPQSTAARETADGASEPLSILIVEDAEVNQLLFRRMLEASGHRVTVVSTGEEALKLVAGRPFDAMLIDYQLPGIDGAETARRVAAVAESRRLMRPRLICLTAHAGLADEGLPPGLFDAFLAKPLSNEKLLAALQATALNEELEVTETIERELAEAFLGVYEDQRDQIADAIAEQQWDRVALLTHRFRGQVGYFGVEELTSLLERLEASCRRGETEKAIRLAEESLAALHPLADRLRSLVHAEPTTP